LDLSVDQLHVFSWHSIDRLCSLCETFSLGHQKSLSTHVWMIFWTYPSYLYTFCVKYEGFCDISLSFGTKIVHDTILLIRRLFWLCFWRCVIEERSNSLSLQLLFFFSQRRRRQVTGESNIVCRHNEQNLCSGAQTATLFLQKTSERSKGGSDSSPSGFWTAEVITTASDDSGRHPVDNFISQDGLHMRQMVSERLPLGSGRPRSSHDDRTAALFLQTALGQQ